MLIEIKNLKIAASLSEETNAYTADIFVDGVKTFAASNHGHGGCDSYHRYPTAKVGEREVDAWLAANVPPDGPWNANPAEREPYDTGTTCNLEVFMGRYVDRHISAKEDARIRRLYEKKLADRICALNEQGHFVLFGKAVHKPTAENLAHLRAKCPDVIFLADADEATKERGLRAFCPEFGGSRQSDADLREGVYERLRTNALTVADAKWLLAEPQNEGKAADPEVDAHLRQVIETGETAEAAYRAKRDAEFAASRAQVA